jgi:hypothetical protein
VEAPVIATPTRSDTASGFATFVAAAVLTISAVVGLVALAALSPWAAVDADVIPAQYGEGYPLHGGLAGPSRLSVWEMYPSYGAGYPLQGGLAGPSRLSVWDQPPSYGASYPLHGGLAGPSGTHTVDHPGYGEGYPSHGGLAGPSQLEGDR